MTLDKPATASTAVTPYASYAHGYYNHYKRNDWTLLLVILAAAVVMGVVAHFERLRLRALRAKFVSHTFDARSFDTMAHVIDYEGRGDAAWASASPSEPAPCGDEPPWGDLRPTVAGAPGLVYLWWLSMDGTPLEALVDLAAAIGQPTVVRRLVRRRRGSPDLELDVNVFLEINDRTVNVFIRPGIGVILPPTGLDVDATWRWHVSRVWSRTFGDSPLSSDDRSAVEVAP